MEFLQNNKLGIWGAFYEREGAFDRGFFFFFKFLLNEGCFHFDPLKKSKKIKLASKMIAAVAEMSKK